MTRRGLMGFLLSLIPASKLQGESHWQSDGSRPLIQWIPIEKLRFCLVRPLKAERVEWMMKGLRENGLRFPLLVRRSEIGYPGTRHEGYYYRVIDGRTRLLALAEMGWTQVPVIVVTLIPPEYRNGNESPKLPDRNPCFFDSFPWPTE